MGKSHKKFWMGGIWFHALIMSFIYFVACDSFPFRSQSSSGPDTESLDLKVEFIELVRD